jgi:long-subunit acyl-CoA synthetase (AMP-forming)
MLLAHATQRPDHPAYREKDLGIWQTYGWAQTANEVRARLWAGGAGLPARHEPGRGR